MKILLFLIPILLVAAFLYFRMKSNTEPSVNFSKELQYGPFTIQVKASSGKSFNLDKGSVSYTNVVYSIFHNGQAVVFPGALQTNTGLPFLWRVYALPGAPDPTLVAGSQSLYLIYLKNGSPVVEPLLQQHHDFASLQFLDSENGQPGVFSEVYMKNNTADLDKLDSLDGGRYLMTSEHAVLDVQSRKLWPMNSNNNDIDNYAYPSPHGALAFSPDQKTIVFKGHFQSWNTANENLPDSEHALIAYQFEKDKGYSVKFDDTDTRMNSSMEDFGQEWFNTYFEWASTPEGDRLQLIQFEKLPHWTGRIKEDNYYTLYPVKPEMLPVFFDFVLAQMAWTKDNIQEDKYHEYTGRKITLGSAEVKLDIIFKEDERQLTLSKHLYDDDNPASLEAVKKIAAAFDAELSAGKLQEHFGRVINETKQIHGMKDY